MITCQLRNCFPESTNGISLQEKNRGKLKENKLNRTRSILEKLFSCDCRLIAERHLRNVGDFIILPRMRVIIIFLVIV